MLMNRGRAFLAALVLALAGAAPAIAQDAAPPFVAPASESVTITGIKDLEAAISRFVGTMTAPTQMAGKLARWKEGVCPLALGLRPEVAKMITRRLRAIAEQVGAPVNPKESCAPNIEIVFTTEPQAVLNNIRVMHSILLGYHSNSAQAEKLATVTHPIQSWYMTATVDLHGRPQIDTKRTGGVTMTMAMPGFGPGAPPAPPMAIEMNMPDARATAVTGNRLGDGLSSAFANVVIVADMSKLMGRAFGPLADYIAVLALSQVPPPDSCQELPSILNLLVADCSRAATELTSGDFAYLQALYKTTATANFHGQRQEMIYQMDHSLDANKQ